MLSTFHIFKDPILLERVRSDIKNFFGDQYVLEIDPTKLIKEHLLSSLYAETLRLHVKTYFMVSSPHTDVHLGRWSLPKGGIGLMNAGVSHMDEIVWNSRGDEYPVTSFWADRFIIDPTDSQSGPVSPHARDSDLDELYEARESNKTPFFSMNGTEGSWFPYGGEKS